MEDKADALAGLRPGLLKDLAKHPELKILDGKFTAVQQAVGTPKKNTAAAMAPRIPRSTTAVPVTSRQSQLARER